MKKELGPMAKLHLGPDNKATGNGKNSISSENVNKIAQNMVSAGISGAAGGAIGKMVGGKSNIAIHHPCHGRIQIKRRQVKLGKMNILCI